MLYVHIYVDGKASAFLIQFFYSLAILESRSLFVPAPTTLTESPPEPSPPTPPSPSSTKTPTAFIRFRKYFPR